MVIRPAEPHDLSRIITFDAFPGDRIIEIVDRRMLVFEIEELVVGYIAWQQGGCLGMDYVNKLVVANAYRRLGVAQKLVGALHTALEGRIFISAGARNTAAVTLLNGTGWTFAGQLTGLLPMDEQELFFHRDF